LRKVKKKDVFGTKNIKIKSTKYKGKKMSETSK